MKNKLVYILGIIAVILIAIVVVLFINRNEYIPPKMDKTSKSGVPKYVEELGYEELKMSDDYNISIAGKPRLKDKKLYVYFTSNESSKYLFKLRIYKDNTLIKETGLIEPNHYIDKISVGNDLKVGDSITYKVMGYEKDTYYSAGEVELNVRVW